VFHPKSYRLFSALLFTYKTVVANYQKLENKLIEIIENDDWMTNVLKVVRDLNLNDCWIGAGFVRNKIWDEKHEKDRTELNDIDVIYFDKLNTNKESDLQIENKLIDIDSNRNWSVKNQARMHLRNGHKQYSDCNEAISFWPETATSIAVRLNFKIGIQKERYNASDITLKSELDAINLNDFFIAYNITSREISNFENTAFKFRGKKLINGEKR